MTVGYSAYDPWLYEVHKKFSAQETKNLASEIRVLGGSMISEVLEADLESE